MITLFKVANRRADLLNHADAFMPQHAACRHFRHIALEDMQVGATNGGVQNPDDGVGGFIDDRRGDFRPLFFAGALVGERFHDSLPLAVQESAALPIGTP